MKMYLRFPVDSDGHWPSRYREKSVMVDVTQIRFPDGTEWDTDGDRYIATPLDCGRNPEPAPTPATGLVACPTLVAAIGAIPRAIVIEFGKKEEK